MLKSRNVRLKPITESILSCPQQSNIIIDVVIITFMEVCEREKSLLINGSDALVLVSDERRTPTYHDYRNCNK